jgi:hypothetical protein
MLGYCLSGLSGDGDGGGNTAHLTGMTPKTKCLEHRDVDLT